MAELTLEESIRQILPTLPLPIQKFFEQRKLDTITRLLTERYALHLDQGTIIERELMFLLLGLKSPDEFAAELYEQLPVSKQTVKDIISDINQEVFVPLREEEMRKGGESPAQPVKPPMPRPTTTSSAPQPQPASSPSLAQSMSHFHLQNKIAPPMRSMAARPISVPTPSPTQVPAQQMPASKMLEDHEEPHIEFSKAPAPSPVPARAPIASQMPLRPASAFAKAGEPPANLPGAMPSGVIPPGGRPSFMTPPKMQPPAPELPKQAPPIAPQGSAAPRAFERAPMPPAPPTTPAPTAPKTPPPAPKSYSVDPYREPIE